MWALDLEFDETADLRHLELLNIVDEHTREAVAMDIDQSITGDFVLECLDRLVARRGIPESIRRDNRPELIAWVLSDWCRLRGIQTIYIEPGSPRQTPWVESSRQPFTKPVSLVKPAQPKRPDSNRTGSDKPGRVQIRTCSSVCVKRTVPSTPRMPSPSSAIVTSHTVS